MKNTKKHIFKRKRYGWGWVPASPLGWTILALYLAIVIGGAILISDTPEDELTSEVVWYLAVVFVGAAILMFISYKFGPKPKWRWGKKDSDNPDEDF